MHVVKPNWVAHPDETRATRPDLTIFSLDVHPDTSRLATGGLDSLVKVWSTVPILNEQAERDGDEKCPKLLSTLSAHTGALPCDSFQRYTDALAAPDIGVVMSVRWNNAGSYLASGSDDRVVVIWAHDGLRSASSWRFPPRTLTLTSFSPAAAAVVKSGGPRRPTSKTGRPLVASSVTSLVSRKACCNFLRSKLNDPTLADVAGVAWSPDDALLASVGLDNVVLVWSGHTFGELLSKVPGVSST